MPSTNIFKIVVLFYQFMLNTQKSANEHNLTNIISVSYLIINHHRLHHLSFSRLYYCVCSAPVSISPLSNLLSISNGNNPNLNTDCNHIRKAQLNLIIRFLNILIINSKLYFFTFFNSIILTLCFIFISLNIMYPFDFSI